MDKKLFTILQLTIFFYLDLCEMVPDQKDYFPQNYSFDTTSTYFAHVQSMFCFPMTITSFFIIYNILVLHNKTYIVEISYLAQ